MRKPIVASCIAVVCLCAAAAGAQTAADGEPDPANVRVRLGPLLLNPTISLTNAGVDDNVFNDPSTGAPKRDFTLTVTPRTDLWLHVGSTWVVGNIKEDINWYQKYASERSANTTYGIGWRVPLSRLAFKVNSAYANTRERPGFEIDARALQTDVSNDGSVEYRALSRTYIGVTARRATTSFADDATFLDTNLHDQLNRVSTSYGVTLREQITALTAVTFTASRSQDRFDFSTLRDSKSSDVQASVSFDPAALITGSASIGYQNFTPQSSDLPGYNGLSSAVNLSYTLLGSTKFVFGATRSVQYSYGVNQPYYVLTGFNGSIAQQIFGPVDIVARGGHQNLDYRDRSGAPVAAPNRQDEVVSYGGGVGYHLGKSLRLGFNVDQSRRTSPLEDRTYQGLRFGTALTYGQ